MPAGLSAGYHDLCSRSGQKDRYFYVDNDTEGQSDAVEGGEESDENRHAAASSVVSVGRPKSETDDDAKLKRREENARYYEKKKNRTLKVKIPKVGRTPLTSSNKLFERKSPKTVDGL